MILHTCSNSVCLWWLLGSSSSAKGTWPWAGKQKTDSDYISSRSALNHRLRFSKSFAVTEIQILHISLDNAINIFSASFGYSNLIYVKTLWKNTKCWINVKCHLIEKLSRYAHIYLRLMVVTRFSFKHSNRLTDVIAILFPKNFALLLAVVRWRLLPTHQWLVGRVQVEVVKVYNNVTEICR